jgi:hypothetical protein
MYLTIPPTPDGDKGERMFGMVAGMRRDLRMIGAARPVRVSIDRTTGIPRRVRGREVRTVRDEWLVDEGWWTGRRLRRRYLDLVLADGSNQVVFQDLDRGVWWSQRA